MADDFEIKVHDGREVPYIVDDSGVHRLLTALPTPKDHPIKASLTSPAEAGIPTLTIAQIEALMLDLSRQRAEEQAAQAGRSVRGAMAAAVPEIDRVRKDVPILDQSTYGCCLPHAFAEGMMIVRADAGDDHL